MCVRPCPGLTSDGYCLDADVEELARRGEWLREGVYDAMATAGTATIPRPLSQADLALPDEEDPFAEEMDPEPLQRPMLVAGDAAVGSRDGSPPPAAGVPAREVAPFSPLETVAILTGGGRVMGTFCVSGELAVNLATEMAAKMPAGSELQLVRTAGGCGVQLTVLLAAERGIRRLLSGFTPLLKMLPDVGVTIAVRWTGGSQARRLVVKGGSIYREVEKR